MEELQQRHRKEAKDLQSKITQKKKGATKKTRKGVNDECDNLEREMKARHQDEVKAMTAPTIGQDDDDQPDDTDRDQGEETAKDADELADRTEGLSIASPTPAPQSTQETPAPKKQNRAKARLARRAAEQEALIASAHDEAQDMPNLKAAERESMLAHFSARKLAEKEIRADGHCLYSAIADQLHQLEIPLGPAPDSTPDVAATLEPYRLVRHAAAEYIQAHPNDFTPFLEEPLDYYIYKIKNTGEWGGQLELMALAKKYNVAISVLQGDGRVEEINPDKSQVEAGKQLWLAYYRHGFGLGEHYNSLRKAG
ncbi:cysteine proteinase [Aureobasidium namibiae CBS 147.97]|uniref:Cysteine proteinase n=1 Tax=Aureobasidium namibiae CBS 147.97 TaxID=1043004 RepID=A0A074WTT9_9PEZI|nr:cysteine proteinase [Aureobasidium namibiae CBS 147.97]KEQ76558.1 cysteine proteinase [Aureobasidium namibiae CBS 147.97]